MLLLGWKQVNSGLNLVLIGAKHVKIGGTMCTHYAKFGLD